MKEVKYTNGIPICPTCDKPTHRSAGMSSTTCMGFLRVYDENGNDVSSNPNITTSSYFCQNCRKEFSIRSQFGKSEYVDHLKQTYS